MMTSGATQEYPSRNVNIRRSDHHSNQNFCRPLQLIVRHYEFLVHILLLLLLLFVCLFIFCAKQNRKRVLLMRQSGYFTFIRV